MTEQLLQPLKVALVAGEASGDILGAGLMQAIREHYPQVEFIGVGGPLMEAQGLQSYFPMERLAIMGLVEVLGRLPELLARRKRRALKLCIMSVLQFGRGDKSAC